LSADPGDSDRVLDIAASAEGSNPEQAGGLQRLVEIRRAFAELARKEAHAASARVTETKHLLEAQTATVAQAQSQVDPAATNASKDDAHRAFRAAVAAARGRGQVEAAASTWLSEINRINMQSRVLQARLKNEREVAEALVAQLAKLSTNAEASAKAAAKAIEACRDAEAQADASAAGAAITAPATDAAAAPIRSPEESGPRPSETAPDEEESDDAAAAGHPSTNWLVIDIRSPEPQAIIRLVRRDGRTLNTLVDRLAGGDPTARSCWGLLLSNFVDSVAAAAIEDACLVFPPADPFWSQFNAEEAREVARGLAALGFRYDGFGSFADGRIPGQRDLAMAVGSAGLLPARIRYWPKSDETEHLLRGVTAAADTFIATMAPALTLGELVRLLGRRADLLADLWNDWPRVRPLLFATNL
jgi:hypothetical protein